MERKMLLVISMLLNLVQALDQKELKSKQYNDCWSVQIINETPYLLEINPDDVSYNYFKDEDRQSVFSNIFYLTFSGYDLQPCKSSSSLSYLSHGQSLSDVASLKLIGKNPDDLLLKVVSLDKTEHLMRVCLRAVCS